MKRKDDSVETQFHPILTAYLMEADEVYRLWDSELVISSGSELTVRHSFKSLHYAVPCQAADIRSWEIKRVPSVMKQAEALRETADIFADRIGIPRDWIEVHIEVDHIHIEFQPKRQVAKLEGSR